MPNIFIDIKILTLLQYIIFKILNIFELFLKTFSNSKNLD